MTQRTTDTSNYNRIVYEVTVQRLLRFGDSLGTPADQAAASAWVTEFERLMVRLCRSAGLSCADFFSRVSFLMTRGPSGLSRWSSQRCAISWSVCAPS